MKNRHLQVQLFYILSIYNELFNQFQSDFSLQKLVRNLI